MSHRYETPSLGEAKEHAFAIADTWPAKAAYVLRHGATYAASSSRAHLGWHVIYRIERHA